MSGKLTIGIDLGGTHIKGLLVKEDGNIIEEINAETRDDPNDMEGKGWKKEVLTITNTLQERSGNTVKLTGLSAPGLANKENTCIAYMPNRLIGLENFKWSDYLGVHTFVLNDAHAHLIAESRFGAGKGYRNILLLTLGTGVGGGVMIDGKLYQGEIGRAGHFGHISISQGDTRSIAGAPGSLEYAVGECTLNERSNGTFTSSKGLVEAYLNGDDFAASVWLQSVEHLARGIISLINAFSPQLIILGGGITQAGNTLLDPLNDCLDQYEWRPGGYKTEIKLASTGKNSGALGAALFAMTNKYEI